MKKNRKKALALLPLAGAIVNLPLIASSCGTEVKPQKHELSKDELNTLAKQIKFELIADLTKEQILSQKENAFNITNLDSRVQLVFKDISIDAQNKIIISYQVKDKTNQNNLSDVIINDELKLIDLTTFNQLNHLRDVIEIKAKPNLYAFELVEKKTDGLEIKNIDPKVEFKLISVVENSDYISVNVTFSIVDKSKTTNESEPRTIKIKAKEFPSIVEELTNVSANVTDISNTPWSEMSKDKITFSNFDNKVFEIVDFEEKTKEKDNYKFEFKLQNKYTKEKSEKKEFTFNELALSTEELNQILESVSIQQNSSHTKEEFESDLLNNPNGIYKTVTISGLSDNTKVDFISTRDSQEPNKLVVEYKISKKNIPNNHSTKTKTIKVTYVSQGTIDIEGIFENATLTYEGGIEKVNAYDVEINKIKLTGLKNENELSNINLSFVKTKPDDRDEVQNGTRKIEVTFNFKGKQHTRVLELKVQKSHKNINSSLKNLNSISIFENADVIDELEKLTDNTELIYDAKGFRKQFGTIKTTSGKVLFNHKLIALAFSKKDLLSKNKVIFKKDTNNYYLTFTLGYVLSNVATYHYETTTVTLPKLVKKEDLKTLLEQKKAEFDYKNKATTYVTDATVDGIIKPDFGDGYEVVITELTRGNDKLTFNAQLKSKKINNLISNAIKIEITGFKASQLMGEIEKMNFTIEDSFKSSEAKDFTDVSNLKIKDKTTNSEINLTSKGITVEKTITSFDNYAGTVTFNLKFTKNDEIVNIGHIVSGFKVEEITLEKIKENTKVELVKNNVKLDASYFLASYITKSEISISGFEKFQKYNSTIKAEVTSLTSDVSNGTIKITVTFTLDSKTETKEYTINGFSKSLKTSTQNMEFAAKMKLLVYLAKNNLLFAKLEDSMIKIIKSIRPLTSSIPKSYIQYGLKKYSPSPFTFEDDFKYSYIFDFIKNDAETDETEKFDSLVKTYVVGSTFSAFSPRTWHLTALGNSQEKKINVKFIIISRNTKKTEDELKTYTPTTEETSEVFTWELGSY
ncbi:lipoprotein 17-related variable surface protein [Mycoplasmopsis caviae]|uniref:Lipoprotein 17-related variable surface protein n=1 Tax=Mycoplasmopsis caviae TaxID=55603 RepID=A0A3P8MEL9_9BACT|nr:lipoprotein 17-related variable surface protein [Mycoplasmopsis caviae]UUD35259.1 lipoprotein 17-related variable surface protein [Mycoplasmopsis caviae]VDR41956.1 Uncharacterised protein [Mycoplasmopsis caviae]